MPNLQQISSRLSFTSLVRIRLGRLKYSPPKQVSPGKCSLRGVLNKPPEAKSVRLTALLTRMPFFLSSKCMLCMSWPWVGGLTKRWTGGGVREKGVLKCPRYWCVVPWKDREVGSGRGVCKSQWGGVWHSGPWEWEGKTFYCENWALGESFHSQKSSPQWGGQGETKEVNWFCWSA